MEHRPRLVRNKQLKWQQAREVAQDAQRAIVQTQIAQQRTSYQEGHIAALGRQADLSQHALHTTQHQMEQGESDSDQLEEIRSEYARLLGENSQLQAQLGAAQAGLLLSQSASADAYEGGDFHIQQMRQQVEALTNDLQTVHGLYAQTQFDLQQAQQLQEETQTLRVELQAALARDQAREHEMSELRLQLTQPKDDVAEHTQLQAQLSNAQTQAITASEEITRLRDMLQMAENKQLADQQQLQTHIATFQEERDAFQLYVNTLQTQVAEMQGQANEAVQLNATVLALEAERDELTGVQDRVIQAISREEDLEHTITQLHADIEQLRDQIAQSLVYQEQVLSVNEKLAEKEQQEQNLITQLYATQQDNLELQQSLTKEQGTYEHAHEVETAAREQAEQSLLQLQSEIDTLRTQAAQSTNQTQEEIIFLKEQLAEKEGLGAALLAEITSVRETNNLLQHASNVSTHGHLTEVSVRETEFEHSLKELQSEIDSLRTQAAQTAGHGQHEIEAMQTLLAASEQLQSDLHEQLNVVREENTVLAQQAERVYTLETIINTLGHERDDAVEQLQARQGELSIVQAQFDALSSEHAQLKEGSDQLEALRNTVQALRVQQEQWAHDTVALVQEQSLTIELQQQMEEVTRELAVTVADHSSFAEAWQAQISALQHELAMERHARYDIQRALSQASERLAVSEAARKVSEGALASVRIELKDLRDQFDDLHEREEVATKSAIMATQLLEQARGEANRLADEVETLHSSAATQGQTQGDKAALAIAATDLQGRFVFSQNRIAELERMLGESEERARAAENSRDAAQHSLAHWQSELSADEPANDTALRERNALLESQVYELQQQLHAAQTNQVQRASTHQEAGVIAAQTKNKSGRAKRTLLLLMVLVGIPTAAYGIQQAANDGNTSAPVVSAQPSTPTTAIPLPVDTPDIIPEPTNNKKSSNAKKVNSLPKNSNKTPVKKKARKTQSRPSASSTPRPSPPKPPSPSPKPQPSAQPTPVNKPTSRPPARPSPSPKPQPSAQPAPHTSGAVDDIIGSISAP